MKDADARARDICRVLIASGTTVAVAESLTSGRVQSHLGSVPGASAVFRGGITAYMVEQKVAHLGVDRAHAEVVDGVSERVAAEMARGARALFDASMALATTGYAEPAPDSGVEQPFAFVAADVLGLREVWRVEGGDQTRTEVQALVARTAIENLWGMLRAIGQSEARAGELGRVQRAAREM